MMLILIIVGSIVQIELFFVFGEFDSEIKPKYESVNQSDEKYCKYLSFQASGHLMICM